MANSANACMHPMVSESGAVDLPSVPVNIIAHPSLNANLDLSCTRAVNTIIIAITSPPMHHALQLEKLRDLIGVCVVTVD